MGKLSNIVIGAMLLVASDVASQLPNLEIDWVTTESARYVEAETKSQMCVYANNNTVDFGIDNSGVLESKSDGTYRWTLGLRSDWALNMSVDFKDLKMGEEDQLVVITPDGEQLQIYTSEDVKSNGKLSTLPLAGDSIIVEVSGRDLEKADFRIEMISVGFRSLPEHMKSNKTTLKSGYGSSESCEVDVTCDDVADEVKQSVCRLIVKGSKQNSYGTGSLVNNTRQDGTPYILTAAHVLNGDFRSATALFNFESPVCQEIQPTTTTTATIEIESVLVLLETRDIMLLKMKKAPSSTHRPYWVGWNATTNIPNGGLYCVHHPNADVRKISKSNTATPGATYSMDKTNNGEAFDMASHWLIEKWEQGTTEGGSSGCGLLDANNRIIGTLSGGSASCKKPTNDYFAMVSKSWSELSKYLSPDDEDQKEMDGAWLSDERYEVVYSIDKESVIKSNRPADKIGYVAGHNNYGTTAIAQHISMGKQSSMEIEGIMLIPKAIGVRNNTYQIAIWENNDGEPGNVIMKESYTNTLSRDAQTYLEFTEKAIVTGDVFAGIIIDYTNPNDTIALYHADGDGGRFYQDGEWRKATYFGEEKDQSIMIGLKYKTLYNSALAELKIGSDIKVAQITDGEYEISAEGLKKVEVFDMLGRKVMVEKTDETDIVVMNLGSYSGNCIIIKATTDKGYGAKKMVVK